MALSTTLKAVELMIDAGDSHVLVKCDWHLSYYGMVEGTVIGRKVKLHRLIMNAPDHLEVDHINGNRLDNRKTNLRLCTREQNQRNVGINSTNTSGYKGVSWCKPRNGWRVRIKIHGKEIQLGLFSDKIKAAIVYNEAAKKYFGEFAHLNVIPSNT